MASKNLNDRTEIKTDFLVVTLNENGTQNVLPVYFFVISREECGKENEKYKTVGSWD